jgi:hypothetical protein
VESERRLECGGEKRSSFLAGIRSTLIQALPTLPSELFQFIETYDYRKHPIVHVHTFIPPVFFAANDIKTDLSLINYPAVIHPLSTQRKFSPQVQVVTSKPDISTSFL